MAEQNRSGAYTQFVYSPTGFEMQIMNGQSATKLLVPLPGGGEVVYNASGMFYYHSDHLGSFRFGSSYTNRNMYFDLAYAPFGETYATSGSTDISFTGQRQDTVSGLYDFPAREYSIQGRWPSPDPAGLAAVDPTNPQSWNRYAYALNNPLLYVDPTGMSDCAAEEHYCDWNGGTGEPGGGLWGGPFFGPGNPGNGCEPWDASCGGIGIGIGIDFGGGGTAGGGGGSPPQSGPVHVPGTTFPGNPAGQTVCVIQPNGTQVCISAAYLTTLFKVLGPLVVAQVFLEALGANFVHEFKAGGCVNFFGKAALSAANPISSSPSIATDTGVGVVTVVGPAARWNAAVAYAASRTNVLGGQGLIFPQNSIPYNQILNGNLATSLTEGGLAYLDGALAQGLFAELEALFTGACD